jgi:hypothetical protein
MTFLPGTRRKGLDPGIQRLPGMSFATLLAGLKPEYTAQPGPHQPQEFTPVTSVTARSQLSAVSFVPEYARFAFAAYSLLDG